MGPENETRGYSRKKGVGKSLKERQTHRIPSVDAINKARQMSGHI